MRTTHFIFRTKDERFIDALCKIDIGTTPYEDETTGVTIVLVSAEHRNELLKLSKQYHLSPLEFYNDTLEEVPNEHSD